MDAIVYVTLSGTVFAVVISFITLYLSHLKGVDITLSVDKEKSEIEELPVDAFERDIPTNLRGKISLFVLNKGNRTGAIRITNLKFNPDETGFAKFFEKDYVYISSAKSAKSPPNLPATPPMSLIIKDGDADLINIDYSIELNPIIKKGYGYNLKTVNIESGNLREFLKELSDYKKERLKEFISFLHSNEKLGKIEISYKYTKKQWLKREPFKDGKISIEVAHSFKETLRYYEDSLQSYQLDPQPEKIISHVISEIDRLKLTFDRCYEDIERHRNEELFGFSEDNTIKKHYFDQDNEDIELLKKCKDYKGVIERNAEPLLRDIVGFSQMTVEALQTPEGKRKQNLIDELKRDREPLRRRLITESSKINDLRKMIEQELEEMS
ncbi:MAG: hypothetical protein WBD09_06460 [Halobacteriota archaeon]